MHIVTQPFEQPKQFAFSSANAEEAQRIIGKYPAGRQQSAVMPLLMMAQNQHDNWLPRAAIALIAEMLGMPFIRVYEVATFYTMYNLAPVGRNFIECCTTTPCWLRGSDEVVRAMQDELGIPLGGTTADGLFTTREVECLGACVNAPMVQVGEHFYEDLTYESTRSLLQQLRAGKQPKPGPQSGRRSSEPASGLTSLRESA